MYPSVFVPCWHQVLYLLSIHLPGLVEIEQSRQVVFSFELVVCLLMLYLVEKWVHQGVKGGNTFQRTVLQYSLDQVNKLLAKVFAFYDLL